MLSKLYIMSLVLSFDSVSLGLFMVSILISKEGAASLLEYAEYSLQPSMYPRSYGSWMSLIDGKIQI